VQNISRGRVPDGGATIDFIASPSPGTVNNAALAKPGATIAKSVTNGMLNITVSTTPGFSYQLQYVNDLNVLPYINIGTPVVATGSALTFEQAIIQGGKRFYRVVRTP
jgi:hypothetical protein